MLGFTYYTPTKVAFGKGSVERVGELMKQFGGTRVLIHYGGQSAVRSGVLDRVKKSLDEAGIFHVELGGVVPNPHLAKVREGIELSKANGVDFLLAVGGCLGAVRGPAQGQSLLPGCIRADHRRRWL